MRDAGAAAEEDAGVLGMRGNLLHGATQPGRVFPVPARVRATQGKSVLF